MFNNAAESQIARNNSVLESVWLPKLIDIVKSMETWANWLFVSKNKSAHKYTLSASESKLYVWKQ